MRVELECDLRHTPDTRAIGVRRRCLVQSPVVSSDYRLSPALSARLLGVALLLLALAVFVGTLVVSLLGLGPDALLLVVVAGLVAVGVSSWLTRRVAVVHLDDTGYRVRLVRGVGVASAPWADVEDALTTYVALEPCVVLRLRDGRTSTIPVTALATDREEFVRDLQGYLQRGHGLTQL